MTGPWAACSVEEFVQFLVPGPIFLLLNVLKVRFSKPCQSCLVHQSLPGIARHPQIPPELPERCCSFAIHQVLSPPAPPPVTMQLSKRIRKPTTRVRNAPPTKKPCKASPALTAAPQLCAEVAAVASASKPSVAQPSLSVAAKKVMCVWLLCVEPTASTRLLRTPSP